MLQHPVKMIRDTARFAAYMRPKGPHGGKLRPRSLKDLTKQHLGLDIQGGKHDSVSAEAWGARGARCCLCIDGLAPLCSLLLWWSGGGCSLRHAVVPRETYGMGEGAQGEEAQGHMKCRQHPERKSRLCSAEWRASPGAGPLP